MEDDILSVELSVALFVGRAWPVIPWSSQELARFELSGKRFRFRTEEVLFGSIEGDPDVFSKIPKSY